MEVDELRRVRAENLDLAERRAVEQRDSLAGAPGLALDREVGVVRAIPGGPQPAAVFAHLRSVGAVLALERQALERVHELAAPPPADDRHRRRDVKGGR